MEVVILINVILIQICGCGDGGGCGGASVVGTTVETMVPKKVYSANGDMH